jgi:ribose-phosphate pyrophosphokinase
VSAVTPAVSAPGTSPRPSGIERSFTRADDESTMILPGSATQALAASLATETDQDLAGVSFDRFADGERRLQVEGIEAGTDVVVVASTVSDSAHVELLQLQDAAREAGASEVTTVLPYMGYARQDESFEPGQPVSARAVARALSTGTDQVVTVNPHERAVCGYFDVPATAVDAAGLLADPLPALADPVFLAPDAGACNLAETLRDAHGRGEVDQFAKTRHTDTDVDIEPSDTAVAGRDVVLVDDIVATGSTMSEAVGVLDNREAARVYVACVHPVLARDAYTRLRRAGVEAVYGTDTVERPVSQVSAAPAIAEVL